MRMLLLSEVLLPPVVLVLVLVSLTSPHSLGGGAVETTRSPELLLRARSCGPWCSGKDEDESGLWWI